MHFWIALVVEDVPVPDEVVVLEDPSLAIAVVLGNQSLTSEEKPLDEASECLALVRRGMKVTGRVEEKNADSAQRDLST